MVTMSRFTVEELREVTRIGFTLKRGGAWHRDLSVALADALNHFPGAIPIEALIGDDGGLFNFEVVERELFVQSDMGPMPVEGRKALVRSDNGKVLGIHSNRYVGHSYKTWLIENLSRMLGGSVDFANAGLLAGGAQAWVQMEMPENITATGGINFRPFILATTSFDGSIATTYKTGFTNVVCDNTFGMFMAEKTEAYKRKHTRNSEFRMLDAASALNTLHIVAESVMADIEKLLSIEVSDKAWGQFVEAHAPITAETTQRSTTMAETKRQTLTGLWRTDMRVAPWAGTAWGVVQAVNTYNEHFAIVRNVDPFERKMTRAVKGSIATDDAGTLATLGTVIGRELVNA